MKLVKEQNRLIKNNEVSDKEASLSDTSLFFISLFCSLTNFIAIVIYII